MEELDAGVESFGVRFSVFSDAAGVVDEFVNATPELWLVLDGFVT